jgi:hypothetical protein
MKKLIFASMGVAMLFAIACKKDNFTSKKELISGGASGVDTLVGSVTHNTTVTRTTYLQGIVYVDSGVTLTVDKGVRIIGSPGNVAPDTVNLANNKGTLVIEKGAKLIANGTPDSPIVWTSSFPVGSRHFGDWGGLVLLGKARIHTASHGTTNTFEALPASDPRNSYGGTNDADNSGSITYNRFEFGGGVVIRPNQEVNGVTFCGVGNGTTVSHVEVTNSGDDGFEWFGGSVNCDHLIDFSPKDDEYDFDEGYHGNLQFIIAYRTTINDNSGSHGIETDNDAAATNDSLHTLAFIANATFIGPADSTSGVGPGNYYDGEIFFRRNSRLRLVNSLIAAQAQPYVFVSTPTTRPLVAAVAQLSDSVLIAFNYYQSNFSDTVVTSSLEGNPSVVSSDPASATRLRNLSTTRLASFAAFGLDGSLTPVTGSPALGSGVDLHAAGLTQFVGTNDRGAVVTGDHWTSGPAAAWINIDLH